MAQTKTTTSMYISNEVMAIIDQYVAATHRKRSQVIEILIALGHETSAAKTMLEHALPAAYKPAKPKPRKPPAVKVVKERLTTPRVRKKETNSLKKPPVTVEVIEPEKMAKPKPRIRRAASA